MLNSIEFIVIVHRMKNILSNFNISVICRVLQKLPHWLIALWDLDQYYTVQCSAQTTYLYLSELLFECKILSE